MILASSAILDACPRGRRFVCFCNPSVQLTPGPPLKSQAASVVDPDPQPPKRPPTNVDPKAKEKIEAILNPARSRDKQEIDALESDIIKLKFLRDRTLRELENPDLRSELKALFEVELNNSVLKLRVAEFRLREFKDRIENPGTHSLDSLGPGVKPALRDLAAAKGTPALIESIASNALESIRRTQLRTWFLAATGTGHGSAAEDLFGDFMNFNLKPEQLEEVADGILDASWLYRSWRRELATAARDKREVEPAAVAAWLLLGARPDAKLDRSSPEDLRFLDLAHNPALAKMMSDRETARPFRHLVGGWFDRQGDNPPAEVQRLADQFLKGWRQ